MKDLMALYWAFFRIGGLTFGGGLTMLPMLKYELVEKRDWITEEDLIDCYAIGQCTPGIIAINTATFVGYKRKGIAGGIFSTLGMMSPSVIIITLVAMCLEQFIHNVWVQHALMGVRGVVCALMLNTVITLAKKSLVSPITWVICALAFVTSMFTPAPLIVIVIVAALWGIIMEKVKGGKSA
ncbi:MAG: chromate transporter [Lachnospiraceae bacterium]|nr:chromate transporter [Lachnospiraceae bacterium]